MATIVLQQRSGVCYAVRVDVIQAGQVRSSVCWGTGGGSIVVSCCWEKLVAEDGDSSGTQKKGSVRRWKPLPNNGSESVTVDTSVSVCVCVIVNFKL
jgi:hypothetical protein